MMGKCKVCKGGGSVESCHSSNSFGWGAKCETCLGSGIAPETLSESELLEKFTITLPMPPCRICGLRSYKNVSVVGAIGSYCEVHTWSTVFAARHWAISQQAEMMKAKRFVIPMPQYDPLEATDG